MLGGARLGMSQARPDLNPVSLGFLHVDPFFLQRPLLQRSSPCFRITLAYSTDHIRGDPRRNGGRGEN